ncbi:preprotein translocase subunit SecE [Candidatus Desantisbacteria bacterium CG_4_10_14_0_8_um_filter_48_22]|uniref:Protein translocase subunit SecE n=1 Tax=Candidatus Desantisbacteria bacterium CG_4_10_14_0_8_um_filter_48_22 TaxID=1974543 RepID=A0A2M7S9J0_9BACT|nr:MAG: preprotein translocase subunit SecE [Candidatus Desantisbacteria bacterium CG1_02_49_89]PIV54697.1 MAG: preprotein translocase subunit SecE [Candidatus Desantisbacteria bacterium CG02_land_8_20_14_3_00_49_13]PIZ16197.1 MAG: preprotein translocase subunit SecE [Candidatus Desantisbacteria bacterium CG_4_10_14_0_8_um_filter_48_22]
MDNLKPSIFNRIKTFLGEVRIEAKKVTWSTRKELIASTVVIAAMVFVVAGFIWLIDFLLSLLMKLILG